MKVDWLRDYAYLYMGTCSRWFDTFCGLLLKMSVIFTFKWAPAENGLYVIGSWIVQLLFYIRTFCWVFSEDRFDCVRSFIELERLFLCKFGKQRSAGLFCFFWWPAKTRSLVDYHSNHIHVLPLLLTDCKKQNQWLITIATMY
jgi:hypothetical protein